MPRNAERDEREAARRKEQLMKAGFKLFSENGIENVSLQKVADAADVGVATMYKYYQTKVKLVDGDIIPLTQSELASIGGVSQAQMERTIRFLKEKNILSTSRKQIRILDKEKMIQYCTLSMRENIQENRL